MNTDIYPQSVDFNYKIRCSNHQFKPYVYCEMCMVRSELQFIKDDVHNTIGRMVSLAHLAINELQNSVENQRKLIHELQIEVELLKGRTSA